MTAENSARIARLRESALRPAFSFDTLHFYFYKRHRELTEAAREARFAAAFAYALDHAEVIIDDDELIVAKPRHPITDPQMQAEWRELEPNYADKIAPRLGQHDHMAVDYALLLREGIEGVSARIDTYLADCADDGKRRFYEGCKVCLDAVCRLSGRYAETARVMAAGCADAARKAELEQLAEVCAHVPAKPAETFYEAVQSVNFLTYCIAFAPFRYGGVMQYQLGHPDRYLWPYYERDIASGRIDREQAQLLLDCMGIQINQRVPHGLSNGYMVGGRDRDGRIVENELTEMAMQVVDDIRLVYPSVGLCYTEGMDPRILHKACEILSKGCSHPAIFNDDVISAGLRRYGVTEAESHEYIHSTCVEITPVAASSIWVASPYTNMPQLLLDLLDRDYDTFDDLLTAYFKALDAHILKNHREQQEWRQYRYERGLEPLLSCFVNDCLARGTDIEQDGARYNWIMPSFVGVANLVDSLYAIRTAVFDEKWLTLDQLRVMMAADFEGYEAERRRLLNGIPKYGNDDPDVDRYFSMVTEHIAAECRKHTSTLRGFRLVPSVFCWIMHEQFGRQTGATPDGRHAGFPLGDGSGPCQGRERKGPTASILSSTSWRHGDFIGGVAVNMKFSKRTFTVDSCAKMEALIRTYLQRGGFEIQINVVDRDTLLDAQRDPESHRDLVVRIGGYSDYFTTLSPQMQAEVLERTTHEV